MKNLRKLLDEVVAEANAIGIHTGKIVEVSVNTRAQKRWGQCKFNRGCYSINISHRLLEDNVPDKSAKQVIAHEVMHTVPGCFNHGDLWQQYAGKMNKAYGYNISRTDSAEELGVKVTSTNSKYKYKVICDKCKHSYYYTRKSKVVQLVAANSTTCTCPSCRGHKFHVIEI